MLFPNLEKWPNKFEFPIASFILSLANAKGKSADFVISLGKKDNKPFLEKRVIHSDYFL